MRFRASALSLAALLSALSLGLAGCGEDEATDTGSTPPPPTAEPEGTVPAEAPAVVGVYFLREDVVIGEDGTEFRRDAVGLSARPVVATTEGQAGAALDELLTGPNDDERAAGLKTAIPDGTSVVSLEVGDDGVAAVELSGELPDEEAVAQVVFTLTQFPAVERVAIGEDAAVGRADLEDQTPAILVESPTLGESVESPLQITGTANTFEATFQAEVVGEGGEVLGKTFVTATSGTGTRGTFDAEVPFEAPDGGPITLVVYEASAADGSRIHEVEIPLDSP